MAYNPYENPTINYPIGPYKWIPSQSPTYGDSPFGFASLVINRGQFRNDFPGNTVNSDVNITWEGNRTSNPSSEVFPFLAAFRPYENPNSNFTIKPSKPFVVEYGATNDTTGDTVPPSYKIHINKIAPLSTLVLTYSLVVAIDDSVVLNNLSKSDFDLAQSYIQDTLNGKSPSAPDINWGQYMFGVILATKQSSTTFIEYPLYSSDNLPKQLPVTGISYNGKIIQNVTQEAVINFGVPDNPSAQNDPSQYPTITEIHITQRSSLGGDIQSMVLTINKVMLYNAIRANPLKTQTPFSLLQYAFLTYFNYDPASQGVIFPDAATQNSPNLHIKVFSPDSSTGSPGFAHSINLRFIIFSEGDYSFSAIQGGGSLIGTISEIDAGPALYYTVFGGLWVGTRYVRYVMLTTPIHSNKKRVVPLDVEIIPATVTNMYIQKAIGYTGNTAPGNNANWQTLDTLDIDTIKKNNFIYIDTNATRKDWYRLINVLSNGVQQTTAAFNNQLDVENTPLQLFDDAQHISTNLPENITRRVNIVDPTATNFWNIINDLPPFIIYEAEDSFPLASPINFSAGAWNLRFKASTDDIKQYTYTHIFARFWFQPENIDISSTPYQYRNSDEIHFEWTPADTVNHIASKMIMVAGSPKNLSQCMVSPPLSGTDVFYEITRYMDHFVVNNINKEQYSPTFGSDGTRARLVMALYAFSYLTPEGLAAKISKDSYNLPHFTIELNSDYNSIETTINQALSNQILPQRASRYNSSNYIYPDSDFRITNNIVDNGVQDLTNIDYLQYKSKVHTPTSDIDTVFSGLASLLTTAQKNNITPIPVDLPFYIKETHDISPVGTVTIPNNDNQTINYTSVPVYDFVDFVTDGLSYGLGRIDITTPDNQWKITVNIPNPPDKNITAGFIRFEGYLVDDTGAIIERIFTTKWQCNYKGTTPQSILTYPIDINIPYSISGTTTQLVVRMFVHSQYITAPKNNSSDVITPIRISSIVVSAPTLQRLNINQVVSFGGSPAFYEDLPLVPNLTYGGANWFYVASSLNLGIQITLPNENWPFTGVLYSPVFYCNMPENVEVQVRCGSLASALGLSGQTLWLRTVPGKSSATQSEVTLSAAENPISSTVHLVNDEITVNGSHVLHRVWPNGVLPNDNTLIAPNPLYSVVPSGNNQNETAYIQGSLPSICFYNPYRQYTKKEKLLAIVTQANDTNNTVTFALNGYDGNPRRWVGPNLSLTDNQFGILRHIAAGITNPVIASSPNGGLLYVAGYASPGCVVMKIVNPFNADSNDGLAYGTMLLVDGSNALSIDSETNLVIPPDTYLNGLANQTSVGLLIDDTGKVHVCYSLQGYNGSLWCKTLQAGNYFGKAYEIVSLRTEGVTVTSDFTIYGSTMAYHRETKTSYVAFWIAGKILVGNISNIGGKMGSLIKPLDLVAGDSDLSVGAGSIFKSLQNAGKIRITSSPGDGTDLPQQRPGLYVSNHASAKGKLFLYYQTADGIVWYRKITVGGNISPPYKINTPSQ